MTRLCCIICILTITLCTLPAMAGSAPPRVQKTEEIIDAHGDRYLLQKHYGSGYLLSDPVGFHLMDQHGMIAARTPISYSDTIFSMCASIEGCYVFFYNNISPFAQKVWKMSPVDKPFRANLLNAGEKFPPKDTVEWNEYLSSARGTQYQSKELSYPEALPDHPIGLADAPLWMKVLSPLTIYILAPASLFLSILLLLSFKTSVFMYILYSRSRRNAIKAGLLLLILLLYGTNISVGFALLVFSSTQLPGISAVLLLLVTVIGLGYIQTSLRNEAAPAYN